MPYLAIAAAALLLGKYGGRARGLVARWVFALMLFAGIAKQIVAPRLLHPLCWNGSALPRALRSISQSVIRCSSYRCTYFCLSAKSCHVCLFFVQKTHSTESRAAYLKSRGADLKSRTLFFRKCLKTCGFFHTIPYGKKKAAFSQALCARRFGAERAGF